MNPDLQWSTREKLAIASHVFHTGDQHWTGSISRLLRPLGEPDRPPDWFSPKFCAQQYTALVEAAESTRKKRPERSDSTDSISSTLQVPTPSIGEIVLRKATQERIEELKKLIRNEKAKYKKISQTVEQLESGVLDDTTIDKMYEEMQKQIQQDEDAKSRLLGTEVTAETSSVANESLSHPKMVDNTEDSLSVTDESKIDPAIPVVCKISKPSEEIQKDTVPQPSQVTVEKESVSSPAIPSSENVPTSSFTPVIELDAGSEEATTQCSPVHEDASETKEQEPMEISQPSQEQTSVENDNPPLETFEVESIVTSSEVQDSSQQASADLHSTDSKEECVDPISHSSSLDVMALESTVKSELSESQEVASPQKTETHKINTVDDSETLIEEETKDTTQLSAEDNPSQDITLSQDKTAIETPDVSVIEGAVPAVQKTVDDEKTEEESIDYGASVSSSQAYLESYPSSPALSTTSDADPELTAQHRAWKKSIVILWKQVASHRYASLFLHPVTNEIAPNYSSIVLRPMDLHTLKRNVENGVVRTTSEFQRDLMLMFQNALMYNNCEHDVYKMTQEMQKDVMDQVEQFLATQLMMETTKQQISSKGLRRSTLRKSVATDKVPASKRSTEDSKISKK